MYIFEPTNLENIAIILQAESSHTKNGYQYCSEK